MSSTTVLGYDGTALKDKKTAIDLLYGKATLDEVALPARYRIGDDPVEDLAPIPNLRVVPSSRAMAGTDVAIAEDADRNDWFAEILRSYEGDDTVFYLDFPAGYGKMSTPCCACWTKTTSSLRRSRPTPGTSSWSSGSRTSWSESATGTAAAGPSRAGRRSTA